MGAELADSLPPARALFESASEILGYDLLQLCREGPSEKLDSTVYSQPALFVAVVGENQIRHRGHTDSSGLDSTVLDQLLEPIQKALPQQAQVPA